MARGPYQGTFQPNIRPTIVTAPDAIVYINGEQEAFGCPQCSRSFDFNKYITSIQTDLSLESVPGSASIQLSVPRHSIDDFYFDGNPVITPMMEVEIYAKGYYLVEGIPQYYPIFWGLITEVSDNYSGGEHTVSISCSDILKWWELCQMNINPAYTAPSGQQGRNLGQNVFAQANPYDIIFSLAFQSFGDIVVGTGSLNQLIPEKGQSAVFDAALTDLMAYWQQRFSRMRSNLVLYGTQGVAVRGDTLYQAYSQSNPPGTVPRKRFASTAVSYANGGEDGAQMVFDPTSESVAAFRYSYPQAGQIDLWQTEFQTKLELANAAKDAIGYEFYMDVTGDIVFKPPFYNLDVLSNKPVSWIQDIDIESWDFGDSESEVVTQIILQGQWGGVVDYGMPADLTPYASVTDYHLLRRYGWRSRPLNSEFLSNVHAMYYHGLDLLDRMNSRRHRGSVTIPMRPELRIGFPVYIAPKDQIWYLQGISHSYAAGSRAMTTLNLTAKRSKFIAPRGVADLKLDKFGKEPEANKQGTPKSFHYSSRQLSKKGVFKLDMRNAATVPPTEEAYASRSGADNPYDPLVLRHPKTGRIVGYPNIVMAYARPFAPADISDQAGQRKGASKYSSKKEAEKQVKRLNQIAQEAYSRNKANDEDALIDRYLTNRYQYGLSSAGTYVYAHDSSARGGAISELLTIKSSNVKIIPESDQKLKGLRGKTAMIRPVSDERGFEVIGHYRYGRRISLKDGRLITNVPEGPQNRATVDVQVALSGGMQEMLTAASQGLTTVSTGFQNPAQTLSTLTPEDRQTAAILSPDGKSAEFVDIGDNFVDNPTLDSQQKQGSPEVEASQLSRALTLTEMAVKDSGTYGDENCVCLTGRQDLAFISSGYQVKTLSGTSSEEEQTVLTSLEVDGGPVNAGATQLATHNVDRLSATLALAEERLETLRKKVASPDSTTADSQAFIEQERVVGRLKRQLAEAEKDLEGLRSKYQNEKSIFGQTTSELISRVDQFLTDLYKSLDTPHQEFEKAIRGDYLPKTPRVVATQAEEITRPSEFAPPFSAPNRFALGDPEATSGAIGTNRDNITEAWSKFGKKLRSNAKRTSLTKQIERDQASIQRLTRTRDQLEKQMESNAAVIGTNVPKAIENIDKRIADLRQNVLNNQQELRTNT